MIGDWRARECVEVQVSVFISLQIGWTGGDAWLELFRDFGLCHHSLSPEDVLVISSQSLQVLP